MDIVKERSRLKDTGIYINDDLCQESQQLCSALLPILKELKTIDKKAHFRGEKIHYKNRLYEEKNIKELPIDCKKACTKSENDVTVFAGKFSPLSNLFPCKLTVDGQEWNSTEHYFQYQKAKTMGDDQIAARIRTVENPVEVMFIGKTISMEKAREKSDWEQKRESIMKTALEAKFEDPTLKLLLHNTPGTIGEATVNKTWGIGKGLSDKDATNKETWTGKNLMGKLLTNLKVNGHC